MTVFRLVVSSLLTFEAFDELLCNVLLSMGVVRRASHRRTSDDAFAALSDNQLAARAMHDPDAFSSLFDRFFTPVYRFFFIRLRQREDAEDLTSETFERIYTKLDSFKERGVPFSAWVFTIARNILNDHLRKRRLQTVSIDDVEGSDEPRKDFDLTAIDQALLMEKVWKVVHMLPERERQIWALKLSSDMKHSEIADVMNLTENNVNVIVHRSFQTMKSRLAALT
jgi:RNA polymerase sigma-70 factor (ECF subfamily)